MSSRYALPFLLLALACGGGGGEDSTAGPSTGAEASAPTTLAGDLDAVLGGAHRSDTERGRDRYRHPKETLAFFGLEPSSTLVEIASSPDLSDEVELAQLRAGEQLATVPDGSADLVLLPRTLHNRAIGESDRMTLRFVKPAG